ncbi:AAA family ATPase [bacterium]|nr:AAA family ATPase [bacterium]MBU1072198.1 AAA family ATPase [bacterium]MBU1675856.1 AAA family ATPase [bacterium]
MYHEHFGFFTAPFSLSPHLQFLFRSSAFEETMAHLVYGLEGGEDIILITGEIGTGKTLALYNLSQHISKTYRIALINVTQLDFRELLKMLLSELGVQVPAAADRADLLSALKAELVATMRRGQRLLLIIDEAQNLDDATMEGVRLLTNLGPPEEQALQVVLSGQPGLRTKINSPQLAQVRQRIRVHYHLDKLGPEETADYLEHRVRVAGCDRKLFRKDAIKRIHALSDGIPRLVNVIADRALLAAYVDGDDEVHLHHVEEDTSLAKSPTAESIAAAIAARSSESPPPPVPEPKPKPEPATAPSVADDGPQPSDDELDEITEAALAASAAAIEDEREGPDTIESPAGADGEVDAPAVSAAVVAGGDEDESVDVETEMSAPMAVKRRTRGARRILVSALIIGAVSVAALGLLAHRQGIIKLPLLPEPRPVAEADEGVADNGFTTGIVDRLQGVAPFDSVGAVAAGLDDSLAVAGNEGLVAGEVTDTLSVGEPAPLPVDEDEPAPRIADEMATDAGAGLDETPAARELPAPPPGLYVHVGSFRDIERARIFAAECAGHDMPTQVMAVTIDGQLWYRVHVGPYADQADAQQAQAVVQGNRLSTWTMIVRIR